MTCRVRVYKARPLQRDSNPHVRLTEEVTRAYHRD